MGKFKGKVVIITGAGSGIGYQVAKQFIEEGAYVVLNDYNEKLAIESAMKLGEKCIAMAGDASVVHFIYKMVTQAVSEFGKVDIAIANAGVTLFGDFLNFSESDFDKVMNLNQKGSFYLAQAFANQIKKQNTNGKFIVLSSTVGTQSFPNLTAYAMSKAALKMMALSLVRDLSPLGINVNCVGPGATLTERTAKESADYRREWSSVIPIGDLAMPEDIANTILFLCSEEARHIQGQTIMVDGGWSTTSPLP
jgi:3-oxoacyl-[acyl-carrier protein] reductase